MKIDPVISELLPKIQKSLRRSGKAAAALAKARTDLAQLEQTIAEIGEPNYADEAKINSLDATSRRRDLCAKAIDRLEEELDGNIEEDRTLLTQGCYLAQKVLTPSLNARRVTLVAVLRPFCCSDYLAGVLAQKTDSYLSAFSTICAFGDFVGQRYSAGSGEIREKLTQVEAVLKEAAKGDGGDMLQFFRSPAAAPAASAETATPSASTAEKAGAQ